MTYPEAGTPVSQQVRSSHKETAPIIRGSTKGVIGCLGNACGGEKAGSGGVSAVGMGVDGLEASSCECTRAGKVAVGDRESWLWAQ